MMKTSAFWLIFSLLACVLMTSCTSSPETSIPQATFIATLTRPAPPTVTASPTIKPQSSVSPTQTPQPRHTQTLTPVPVGDWQMPAIDLNRASNGYHWIGDWIDNASIILESEKSGNVLVDAYTGDVVSVVTPTPTVDYETLFQARLGEPSRTDDFEITCSRSGLEMARLPGRELVSQSDLQVEVCRDQINWNSDGSVASIVTDQGEVFVWRSDGTQPYQVGETLLGSSAVWSPDNSKLLVLRDNSPAADEASFSIIYLDGRPQSAANAVIEVGNEWGNGSLNWLTNNIVWNFRGCVIPNYCLQDFYDAESGKFLIHNEIGEMGGQDAFLSPDQQWLAMEVSPHADNWDERYAYDAYDSGAEISLILYDLGLHKKHVWEKGEPIGSSYNGGLGFDFIGWSSDSSQFYFVYYPFGNLSADLPFGFTALDRQSLKTQLLIPNVIFTRLSPDGQSIFIVTADRIEDQMGYGIQSAVYTLDGKPITEVQSMAERLEFEALNPTDFYNQDNYDPYPDLIPARWNGQSTKVVFAGPGGNLWLMGANGGARQIVSGLPVEQYWQEKVRFDWSPTGQFLVIQWGEWGWVVQVHD